MAIMQASWTTQQAVLRPSRSDENLQTQMVTHTFMPVESCFADIAILRSVLQLQRALSATQTCCRFLVENVASMSWIDRLEISKYMGVRPLELDSIKLTPTRRRRLYWTNIPHPPKLPQVRDHPSTFVQSCLQNAVALEEKTGVMWPAYSNSSVSLSSLLTLFPFNCTSFQHAHPITRPRLAVFEGQLQMPPCLHPSHSLSTDLRASFR